MHLSNYKNIIIYIIIMSLIGFGICYWAYDRQKNDKVVQTQTIKPPVMIEIIYEKTEEQVLEDIIVEEEPENDILEEDIELLAILIHAEAGNQDLYGKRLVADVVLNRVESDLFPNTIEEVIFQKKPVQFAVTVNGALEKAASNMTDSDYEAARMELTGDRIDTEILYFATGKYNGRGFWKHGDHWFSYQ